MRLNSPSRERADTRHQISLAAEELFAREGIDAVTTRSLAARAQVNVAAVSYHFGGKEKLTLEVFRQVARRTVERRLRSLDSLEADAKPPSLHDVIDSFVDAYINDDDPQSGTLLARFVLKHRVEPSEWTRTIVAEELDGMALRYIAALSRAAPHLDEAAIHWRYHLMVGAILMTLSDETTGARIARLSAGQATTSDRAQFRAQITDFLVAAFGQPPQTSPSRPRGES